MPSTGQIYYIAGAGIAGLTLALALAKFGAKVVVLERNSGISEFGAGVQISPNARRVLDSLGLSDAVSAQSFEPIGIDTFASSKPRPLVTLALGDAVSQKFGAPYAVMHRADLADLLHKATRRFANIDIVFGVRGWDAVSHARGVTLTIDESDGQSRTGRGRAMIGADGVHSLTRRQVLDGPEADFCGRVAWRILLPFSDVSEHLALDRISVFFGTRFHIVCYPLPHRSQMNVALFSESTKAQSQSATAPQLRRSRDPRIAAILNAAGENWTPWPLYTVNAPHWHRGNIGIIGDAAHAMLPFQAQGAAMAIEDAAGLAPLLIAETDPERAFTRFEQMRRDRVARTARLSQANGRIFHLGWPLSVGRNIVIAAQGPHAHLRRLEWLYSHDSGLNQPVSPSL